MTRPAPAPRRAAWLRRFLREDGGSVTAEFVILFPVVLYIFLMGFEVGLYNARELMLRRATNLVIRDVRISTGEIPDYDEMKAKICALSLFPDGCVDSLKIEMRALPLDQWAGIEDRTRCVDRREEVDPVVAFAGGQQNELMLVRVCRLFDPLFPGGGVGRRLPENSAGEYGIRIASGFVSEPLS